jgi:hypothetical protein
MDRFRRVAYSASVGLDASVVACCTSMERGAAVARKETAVRGKSVEVSNTIFRGHTPCYTNYSCTGLLGASQWSWPVWCSVVCCVCGAPLEVVSGAGSFPTTSLPPWEGLSINQATNDRTPSWLAIRFSPTLPPSRQSPICLRRSPLIEGSPLVPASIASHNAEAERVWLNRKNLHRKLLAQ